MLTASEWRYLRQVKVKNLTLSYVTKVDACRNVPALVVDAIANVETKDQVRHYFINTLYHDDVTLNLPRIR